jgi:signal transduction histidine kinase
MASLRQRAPGDPLQVNLRWLVRMILLVVVLPTAVLTGVGILVIATKEEVQDLIFGILIVAFAASIIAGSFLLFFLARRGARLAQMQQTFLSHISHELRTPLAGIRLHTQLLESGPHDSETRKSLDAIQRETVRMQELIERLLAWRHVRSPRQVYQRVPLTIREVVDRVVKLVGSHDEIKVRVRHPDAVFSGDLEAFSEAIANLVRNALKYAGNAGPIELSAQTFGRRAIFSVCDRGPGIPPSVGDQIFDPFFRYISPGRPDPGGLGLGLAIAQEIALAHGGRLATMPRRGSGTRFYISVPLERA